MKNSSLEDFVTRPTPTLRLWRHFLIVELDLDLVICLWICIGVLSGPVPTLVVLPHALPSFAVPVDQLSLALAFSIDPVSFKDTSVGPAVLAETVLLVVIVLALIASAVVPGVHARAVHLIEPPLSFVLPPIAPAVLPIAVYVVLMPLTRIVATIRPKVGALALLFSPPVFALVLAAVRP